MIKKIASIIIVTIFILTTLSASIPAFSASVAVIVGSSAYGIVDGQTIKHIPHNVKVEKFLSNIKGAYGTAITKELYDANGENLVTDGFIKDGMILKIKGKFAEDSYNLKLTPIATTSSFSYYSESSRSYPAHGTKEFDYPHSGVYCVEATYTPKATNLTATFYYIFEGEKYETAFTFRNNGTVGATADVAYPYEAGRTYHITSLIDLDNKKIWLYLNGELISKDKENGDTDSTLRNDLPLGRMSIPHSVFTTLKIYTLASVADFDSTDYKCSLTASSDKVIIDNDIKEIKVLDKTITTMKGLLDNLSFADEKEKDRVALYDRLNEKIEGLDAELDKNRFIVVTSKNEQAKVYYSIKLGEDEADYFAVNEKDGNKLQLLKAIGVYPKDTQIAADAPITRGDVAQYLVQMSNSIEYGETEEFEFSDVKRSNPKRKYISSAAAQGIMSGLGDGSFGVMNKISYNEAITALVRLAGYEPYAKAKGGYPGGYLIAAQEAGITKGVKVNNGSEITNLDFIRLSYNALLAPCFEISSVKSDEAEFAPTSNSTLLSKHHNIYKDTGRVTANRFTDIYGESTGTGKGRIEVDKKPFVVSDNADYDKFLGMQVEFFVRDDKSSLCEIVFMNKTEDVESILIAAKDIGNVTQNTISYTENNRRESAKLRTGFSFIYNARSYTKRTPEDLKITDGELLLVDGDGDRVYETVVARCPEIFIYEASNSYGDMIYTSGGEFEVDMDYCSIVNVDDAANPKTVTLSEITPFSLLTVYRSKDSKCLEIYVTTAVKEGKVTEKDEDKIGVDGKIFETAPSLDIPSLTFTTEYIFRIDALGRIAYIDDENDGEKYGYLISYGKGKGLNPVREMRIVIAAEEYKDYNIAEKLILDGENIKASDLDTSSAIFENGEVKPKLISFKLNNDSEIRELRTEHTSEKVNGRYVTSGGMVTIGGKYAIMSDTLFLSVPSIASETKDYKLYRKPAFKEEYGYTVTVYNVDEDRNCGAVLYFPSGSQSGNDDLTMNAKAGIVQSVRMGVDINGNEVTILELMSGGKLGKYYMLDEDVPIDMDLKFGDVIRFTMNSANTHIKNLAREFRVAPDNDRDYVITPHTSSEYYTFRYGLVDRKTKSYLIMNDEKSNNESFIIPFSSSNSYMVDFETKTIVKATLANYIPGSTYVYSRAYLTYAPGVFVGYKFR